MMKRFLALLVTSTAITGAGISVTLAVDLETAASPVVAADGDFTVELGAGPAGLRFKDSFGVDESIDGYAVRGLISGEYNFTPVLGAQGDLLLRFSSHEEDGDEISFTSLDGALHGFYREPEKFLLGGLVQVGKDSIAYGDVDGPRATRALVGAEGQVFFDQFTFYGQVGLQNLSPEGVDQDYNGWFATGETRYFLTPDLKIEAHAGISELSADVAPSISLDVQAVNLGVGVEYKFANMPFSVFGKYDYSHTTADITGLPISSSIDTQRALVGIKFNLGEDTLQDRDRNGVSLKPVEFDSSVILARNPSSGGGGNN